MPSVTSFNQYNGYSRIGDENSQEIECEETIICFGYKTSSCKKIIFNIFSVFLLGIPFLILHWHCQYKAYMKYSKCSLEEAEILLIQDSHGQYSLQRIDTSLFHWPGSREVRQIRYFYHNLIKFLWDDDIKGFVRLHGLDDGSTTFSHLRDNIHGFTADQQQQMIQLHGENLITINVKSYWRLFIEEVFNPFYIFQAFSVTLWSLDEYYYYASCIVVLTAASIITSLVQTRKFAGNLSQSDNIDMLLLVLGECQHEHDEMKLSDFRPNSILSRYSLLQFHQFRNNQYVLSLASAPETLEFAVSQLQQSEALRDLVAASNTNTVNVIRNGGAVEEISASCLVPGDLLMIPPHGCLMACDAVLLSGNCIVNESMLTGESVPVTKTPPPHTEDSYDPVIHKRYTLFSGTHVIQTRFYEKNKVVAVVVRTGFSTAKGELVRSILFPKPMSGFKFYQDSVRFVIFLFFIAALGMSYCIFLYLRRHATLETILLRTLDIITIVVPPALPAAMTAGTVYSQNRLKKLGIFCISPPRINVSGKVKLVCFDKTGTLTEEGLDMWGILPLKDSKFYKEALRDPTHLPVESPFIAVMATCHSLTVINGELTGDPLDVKMFEATKWELQEPGEDTNRYDMLLPTIVKPRTVWPSVPYEIGIVRQFPFGSAVQCMSVIARILGLPHMTLYVKGAPEKIRSLCSKMSVPENFDSLLMQYTLSGYRVIALAYKNLDPKFSWKQAQRINRDQVEYDLEFLGFMIMQNTLKPETSPVISQLYMAKIRCVMVTGDNILTAVSVARDCGMVAPYEHIIQLSIEGDPQLGILNKELIGVPQTLDCGNLTPSSECVLPFMPNSSWHFAVDGRTWAELRNYHSELLMQIVTKGTIFARMAPDQKTQLVEILQSLDYIVAMCGDGANDCGALKAAHIGISLSEAEASVAAPFTSRVANITCVLKLIQEGRCALVTSFGIFKYMALYSLIQFITILILYGRASILGNMQFLYIDLVITTSIAVVMGRTGPATRLVSERPVGSLMSASNIIPLTIQILLTVGVQLATLYYLMQRPWFEPVRIWSGKDETVTCWENTSLFCVSSYQYLILAVVYSKGRPHRKPFYTNLMFLFTLIVLTAFTTLLLVYPVEPLAEIFELVPLSKNPEFIHFRLWLLVFPAVHLLTSIFVETCIAGTRWLKNILHMLSRKREPKNRYKQIDREMSINSWLHEMSM